MEPLPGISARKCPVEGASNLITHAYGIISGHENKQDNSFYQGQ